MSSEIMTDIAFTYDVDGHGRMVRVPGDETPAGRAFTEKDRRDMAAHAAAMSHSHPTEHSITRDYVLGIGGSCLLLPPRECSCARLATYERTARKLAKEKVKLDAPVVVAVTVENQAAPAVGPYPVGLSPMSYDAYDREKAWCKKQEDHAQDAKRLVAELAKKGWLAKHVTEEDLVAQLAKKKWMVVGLVDGEKPKPDSVPPPPVAAEDPLARVAALFSNGGAGAAYDREMAWLKKQEATLVAEPKPVVDEYADMPPLTPVRVHSESNQYEFVVGDNERATPMYCLSADGEYELLMLQGVPLAVLPRGHHSTHLWNLAYKNYEHHFAAAKKKQAEINARHQLAAGW